MRARRGPIVSLLLLPVVWATPWLAAAADATPILVTQLEKAPELIGRRVEVEGRVASRGPDRLRLAASEVEFRFKPSPRIASFRLQRVRIVGSLMREGTSLRLDIDELNTLPTEAEEFSERQGRIRAGDATQWFELGDWARQRAMLYDDPALTRLADAAYRSGLSARERGTADTAEALLELSRFAREVAQLPDEAVRLAYRAFRRRFKETPPDDLEALDRLAAQIAEALPGCDQPLTAADDSLVKRAQTDPERAYVEVDAAERRKLHRLLWGDVIEQRFMAVLASDPDLGAVVAERAARLVPERRQLADTLKRTGLDAESLHVSDLSRDRVVALAEGYRSLANPDPERARAILEAWAAARRAALGARDADGRLSLARDLASLVGDRDGAVALLQEAWQLAPEMPGLAEELGKLGLVRVADRWTEAEQADRRGDVEMERQIRLGKVVPGMTKAQVLRSLRRPDRVTRVVSGRHVLEQWVYVGTATMRVNLVRPRSGGPTEVLSVHSENGR